MVARSVARRARRSGELARRRLGPDRRFTWDDVDTTGASGGDGPQPETGPLVGYLEELGAQHVDHRIGTFHEHLQGTLQILEAWGQPTHVQHAGIFHAIYSPDARQLLLPDQRDELQARIGPGAETLAFLFSTIDFTEFRGRARRLGRVPDAGVDITNKLTGERRRASPTVYAWLALIAVANAADQLCTPTGAPTQWLAERSHLLRLAGERVARRPPVLDGCSAEITVSDERRSLAAYEQGRELRSTNVAEAVRTLETCVRSNPWVGEPRVLLAEIELERGGGAAAARHAVAACELLQAWGTAWDKRHTLSQWLDRATTVRQSAEVS